MGPTGNGLAWPWNRTSHTRETQNIKWQRVHPTFGQSLMPPCPHLGLLHLRPAWVATTSWIVGVNRSPCTLGQPTRSWTCYWGACQLHQEIVGRAITSQWAHFLTRGLKTAFDSEGSVGYLILPMANHAIQAPDRHYGWPGL